MVTRCRFVLADPGEFQDGAVEGFVCRCSIAGGALTGTRGLRGEVRGREVSTVERCWNGLSERGGGERTLGGRLDSRPNMEVRGGECLAQRRKKRNVGSCGGAGRLRAG